ncbi:MBL fold metallo-hydrolase [Mycobacterium sp. 852002-51152_SCH6134967]|uniref:MBL fold metallo-hydrolase n=1 Tax=Mycobacterium sp. 852002-51152_SCH6134967 TaxID=1834096 RepID=UPI0007FBDA7D|nr:MBL fold metallo-hydrolase [Mycobacterium sp. 852002-51152_SCH6134967]OBF89054.1 MBL fold metallo-hydrolase [Mycobacterium sp. 852002-51152_SCH6134967]
MNFRWDRLADGVFRTRLPFLDVTVGLVVGRDGGMLIDTGSTLSEARAVSADVAELADHQVRHVLLTHNHFDHVLGSGVFVGAQVYCAPPVAETMTTGKDHLRADALRHGADGDEVDAVIGALREPDQQVWEAVVDLGGPMVSISHPGRGHTDHDLIAAVTGLARRVVFCGDLVEESGDPCVDEDSDPDAWPATLDRLLAIGGEEAVYVPGHGAAVDARFIRRQREWLADRKG